MSNDFLAMAPKAQTIRVKIDKWDHTIQNFSTTQKVVKRAKWQYVDWLGKKKRPSSQIFHKKSYQVHKNYNSINNEAESIAQIAECFSKISGISLGSVHNTTQIQAWWHKLLRKEKWGIQKSKVIFSNIINLRPAWATWCHVFKKWY